MAVAAALLVGGCGGVSGGSASPKPPPSNGEVSKKGPDVATDAANALQQAGAVHLKGTAAEDGKPGQIDLRLEGKSVSGTIADGGQVADVVGIGNDGYLKAPRSFWTAAKVPAQAAAMLDGRWVKVPPDDSGSLVSEFSLDQIADQIQTPSEGKIDPVVKPGAYNGQPTVVLGSSDGSSLDVAAVGTPLPLHLMNRSQDGADVTLTDFGIRTNITAPPGALDLGQFVK